MTKVVAAVATAPHAPLELRELQIAEPVGAEILVRTVASGVCHTDLLLRDQIFGPPLPAVPGHEGAGIVEAVGASVQNIGVGDHVMLTQAFCGSCIECRRSHPMNCVDYERYNITGRRANGLAAFDDPDLNANFVGQSSWSSHILVSENNAVKVADQFPLELAAPIGCGLVTGAGAVLNVFQPEIGSSIVVLGAGPVGLAAVMAAAASHCGTIVAVDLHENRRAMATSVGATHVLDARDDDVEAAVLDLTGRGADYAIDAVGIPDVMAMAVSCLRPGGHAILLGANSIGSTIPIDFGDLLFNRRVQGATMGAQVPQVTLPALVELHRTGKFPFDRFVTTYPFERINEAVEASERGEVIKAVLTFE